MSEEEKQSLIHNILMYKVTSSNIVAIGYDDKKQLLRVIFKGNSSYIYSNVEPAIWQELSHSETKGKTLSECIIKHKDKYPYIKL